MIGQGEGPSEASAEVDLIGILCEMRDASCELRTCRQYPRLTRDKCHHGVALLLTYSRLPRAT